jgi:hypothetical protein
VRDNFHWRDLRGLGKLLAYVVTVTLTRTEHKMVTSPRVSPQQFADSMKQEFEEFAKQVMDAVNDAPDGQWIAGSEEQVRDLCAAMRQSVFERAMQKRVNAAEAAFPPSASPGHGQAAGE